MDPIVADPTDAELRNAATLNLEALFRAMSGLEGGVLEQGAGVSRHLTFPTNPMFKGAWATRLASRALGNAIEETVDWFRSRGAPFFFWWTGPETEPVDLGDKLEARGLLSMEGQQRTLAPGIVQTAAGAPAMTLDLSSIDADMVQRVPENFSITEVASESGLHDFKRVFVETYEIPDWAGQAWVDATLAFGLGRSPWRIFVGYLNGEPVATNLQFNGGGYASVYAIATVPKARGKGIGAAITLSPLLTARDVGYRWAALFSTEVGHSVYQRLGFTDTGARINRYMWRQD